MQAVIDGTAPTVSVLMTTWNGARFIAEAIGSVLAQSFADFELIVVDDASTDDTPRVLAGIDDARLRVLRQAANGGVVAARNTGFALARGRYVATLDHDDLSHPERLAKQVAYLDQHPDVVLVATEIEIEDPQHLPLALREGEGGGPAPQPPLTPAHRLGHRHPPDHPRGGDPLLMRWLLHVDNPLTWSSIMLRRDAVHRLGAFVRADYELADDFDLYHRLLRIGEIARLDEVLTVYRWHASNTTYGREDALNANAVKVLCTAYAPLLKAKSEAAAQLVIRHLSDRKPVRDAETLDRLGSTLEHLLKAFEDAYDLETAQRARLAALTGEIWWRSVRAAARAGAPALLRRYRACPGLASGFRPPPLDRYVSAAIGLLRQMRRLAAT